MSFFLFFIYCIPEILAECGGLSNRFANEDKKLWDTSVTIEPKIYESYMSFGLRYNEKNFKLYMSEHNWHRCVDGIRWSLKSRDRHSRMVADGTTSYRYFNTVEIYDNLPSCHEYVLSTGLVLKDSSSQYRSYNHYERVTFDDKQVTIRSLPATSQRPDLQTHEIGSTWARFIVTGADNNCTIQNYDFKCHRPNLNNFTISLFMKDLRSQIVQVKGLIPEMTYSRCKLSVVYSPSNKSSVWSHVHDDFTTSAVSFSLENKTAASILIILNEAYEFNLRYCIVLKSKYPGKLELTMTEKSLEVTGLSPNVEYKVSLTVIKSFESCKWKSPKENSQKFVTLESAPSSPPLILSVFNQTEHSFSIHWNPPNEANGVIVKYDIHLTSKCKYRDSSLCEVCGESWNVPKGYQSVISLKNNDSFYDFTGLSPYTQYKIEIAAFTSIGIGPWSIPEIVLTKPVLEEIEFELNFGENFVNVTLIPSCPYFGPLLFIISLTDIPNSAVSLEYSLERNKTARSFRFPNNLKKGTAYEICLTYRFKGADTPCLYRQSPHKCKSLTPVCKSGKTKEGKPGDAPFLYRGKNTHELTKNSIVVHWKPPKEPNGLITNYTIQLRGRCFGFDMSRCKTERLCTEFKEMPEKSTVIPSHVSFMGIYNLVPFWVYQVRILSENSAGKGPWSDWEIFQVVTRPTLLLGEVKFSVSTTTSAIAMTVIPYCPYTGPIDYDVTFEGTLKSHLKLHYHLPLKTGDLSANFASLVSGRSYKICLSSRIHNESIPKCTMNCVSVVPICKNVKVTCSQIPKPSKTPFQVPWTKIDDYNPFSSIVLQIEAKTFDGSSNGIQKIQIVSVSESKVLLEMSRLMWNEKNILKIDNIKHNSSLALKVLAIGCGNNVSTPVFFASTAQIPLPKIQPVSIDENYQLGISRSANELFKITESRSNILYGLIKNYEIGGHNFSNLFVSDASKSKIYAGKECLKFVIEEFSVVCFVSLDVTSKDEIDIKVQSTVSGSLKTYSSRIYIERTSNLSLTLGVSLFILLIICATSIFVTLFAKRKRISEAEDEKCNMLLTASEDTIGPSNPINISQFVHKYESNLINVKDEYNEIQKCEVPLIALKKSTDAALANRPLNRYANILPYDESRVNLEMPPHYINASWIKLKKSNGPTFIASQGPTKNTIGHFWTMILENNIKLIVMLTKLMEKQTKEGNDSNYISKCEQYWPTQGEKITFGNITVELIEEIGNQTLSHLIERKIKVTNSDGCSITVLQLHYMGWPDHKAPTSPKKLVSLLNIMQTKIINVNEGSSDPVILVHCSAGVGRTGTLIGLSYIVNRIEEGEPTIDIPKVIFLLRQSRCKMVQHPIQYSYLYSCISYYIKENIDYTRTSENKNVEVQYLTMFNKP